MHSHAIVATHFSSRPFTEENIQYRDSQYACRIFFGSSDSSIFSVDVSTVDVSDADVDEGNSVDDSGSVDDGNSVVSSEQTVVRRMDNKINDAIFILK